MAQTDKLCENCCYWQKTEGESIPGSSVKETVGICRLLPPVALDSGTRWPVTKAIDWCGEFDHVGPDAANEF